MVNWDKIEIGQLIKKKMIVMLRVEFKNIPKCLQSLISFLTH